MNGSLSLQSTLSATGITFFERGWLSSNNVLIRGDGPTALIDSGYCIHAQQTCQLVQQSLGQDPLDLLLNTHLHSDHCGGNALLQQTYPAVVTYIASGMAQSVTNWDRVALSYETTGQECPPFHFDKLLEPGTQIQLGSLDWDILAAKGHDPHSCVLFQSQYGILISADALWANGFGVVFPELDGYEAFSHVSETLDLIEKLAPKVVIPGHGSIFQDVDAALQRARSRLAYFVASPDKHLRYAIKVLIKYHLLERQETSMCELMNWAKKTPYLRAHMPHHDSEKALQWLASVLIELEHTGSARRIGDRIFDV